MSAGAIDSPSTPDCAPDPAPTGAARAVAPLPRRRRAIRSPAPFGARLLTAEGASLGFAGWCLRARDHLLTYVANNTLSPARPQVRDRQHARRAPRSPGCVGLVAILWRRLGGPRRSSSGWRAGWRRSASSALAAALLPLAALVRRARADLPRDGRRLRARPAGADPGLAGDAAHPARRHCARASAPASARRWRGCATPSGCRSRSWSPPFLGYTIYFSIITIQNHFRLQTMGYDLGIENNLVWNAAHFNRPLFKTSVIGGPTSTHIGFHETYISYLIGIFYRLAPRPETLLVLQARADRRRRAAALRLRAPPRGRLDRLPARRAAGLSTRRCTGSNLYDFHYLPFAPFFLWWCLWALESRRNVMAVVAVIADAGQPRGHVGAADGGRPLPHPDRRAPARGPGRHGHLGASTSWSSSSS